MDNPKGLTVKFIGDSERPGRSRYRVESNPDTDVPAIAAFLVYIAAVNSPLGFEKTIEIITKNAIESRITKIVKMPEG